MLEIIIILSAVALDQLTKIWSATTLPVLGGSVPLIEGVFHFTYNTNYGAAFGLLQNQRVLFLVITVIAMLVLGTMLIRGRKVSPLVVRVALALFLAGALGNFLDRAILGYVRDFLDFRLINFAIFNVADSCVVTAAGLLMLDVLVLERRRERVRSAAADASVRLPDE